MTAAIRTLVCRSLIPNSVLVAVILAGCASPASHFRGDLAAATNLCPQDNYKTLADRVNCYGEHERPVFVRDLPNVLHSYDVWHWARLSAAQDYDAKVKLAPQNGWAELVLAKNANDTKLVAANAPFWPKDQKEAAALGHRLVNATNSCMKDGSWRSPAYTCARDARNPIIEKEVPATSKAYRDYWEQMIKAAAVRDQSVLAVYQKAGTDFEQAIAPARTAYLSDVEAALQADAAETARQQQDIANLLGLALVGFAAGYTAPTVHTPVFTSCTKSGNMVNCIGQ